MYFTNKLLPAEIISALKKAEIISFFGEIPKGSLSLLKLWIVRVPQLDRQHYNTFKKVLEEINGEWDRSRDGHLFRFDPKDVLAEVISVERLPQRKPHDAFFTPEEVTEEIIFWADFSLL